MSQNSLNTFDKIYLINLEKRPDRLKRFYDLNGNLFSGCANFTVVTAVEGDTLQLGRFNGTPGALGCLESHLTILKDAKEKRYKQILVLEDDFKALKNFDSAFTQGWNSLPVNWDMLYLYTTDYTPPSPYNDYLMKCTASLSTVAYAIRESVFDTMIELLEHRKEPIDVVYGHLHFLIDAYKFKENLCMHLEGFSDVEERNVSHSKGTMMNRITYKIKKLLKLKN